jgi:hypothetical protein
MQGWIRVQFATNPDRMMLYMQPDRVSKRQPGCAHMSEDISYFGALGKQTTVYNTVNQSGC